jgi:transposase-like protein
VARAAFFTAPADGAQRRYEALRAYFVDGATALEAARRFGYAPSTMVAMVRDFEPDARAFFLECRPGPRRAPAKEAARAEILRLRRGGRSVTEIAALLEGTATPLNRTGVWELCAPRASSASARARQPSALSCASTRPGRG